MTVEAEPSGRRRQWLMGAAAVAAVGLGAGGFVWREQQFQRATAGLWNLSLPQPDGTPLRLDGLRGRPLLLNFWATWCAPCVREMPVLDDFGVEYAGQGWRVLGLAIDTAPKVQAFLQRAPVRYPIVLGGSEGLRLARGLGNPQGGLPFTVAFGPNGAPVHRKTGEISAAELAAWARET